MRFFTKPDLNLMIFTAIYFFLAIVLATYSLKIERKESLKTILLILLSLTFFSFFVPLINKIAPLNQSEINYFINIGFYYPLLTFKTSTMKAFDICFQQIMIYYFIQKYLKYYHSKKDIIIKFSAAFFLIHIPLFILFGWLALIFIIPSIIAGLIFSYLILNNKNGIIYSFLVHEFFYVSIAIVARV